MDATESSAPAHPSTDEHGHQDKRPHACIDGFVFVGHLVEEDGEEVEVIEAVPCRRCSDNR